MLNSHGNSTTITGYSTFVSLAAPVIHIVRSKGPSNFLHLVWECRIHPEAELEQFIYA
jgi:hypothetical protein